ncbi:CBS domain-containing protein [Candidatus Woesearchaeota archaeon]|nr:CBS domain-containing protein [Candidatus Woesearchaeota archaeon]
MVFTIKQIKDIRKKVGMTQFQLAKHAQVSQSLIAKVESGKLDPTYSNAMKIIDALNDVSEKKEHKADELMSKSVISVSPTAPVKDAITKMRKHGFSQLPVITQHKAVGMITESTILDSFLGHKGNGVEDIMESPPPVVSHDTPMGMLTQLIRYIPMVLVSRKGRLVGVITKADILSKMYTSP